LAATDRGDQRIGQILIEMREVEINGELPDGRVHAAARAQADGSAKGAAMSFVWQWPGSIRCGRWRLRWWRASVGADAARLRPTPSLQSLFSPKDRAAARLTGLHEFPAAEDLIVLVTAPGDEPQPDKLLALRALEKQLRRCRGDQGRGGGENRADSGSMEFFKKIVVPNGIFLPDDSEFEAARQRLTRPEMAEQFRRNEAMLAAPGPAAGRCRRCSSKTRYAARIHRAAVDGGAAMKTYGGSDAFFPKTGVRC